MADDASRDIPEEMVEKGAASIDDLLTMLGVEPGEWNEHGGQTTAEVLAAAVLRAALAGRTVVDAPDDGHCAKCGQPFPENIRDVVMTEPRLPFDARDRIERALRDFNAPGVGQIAHRIMVALTDPASGVGGTQ